MPTELKKGEIRGVFLSLLVKLGRKNCMSTSYYWGTRAMRSLRMCSHTCRPSCTSRGLMCYAGMFLFFYLNILILMKTLPLPTTISHQFCIIRSAILRSRGTEGVKRVIAFKPNTVGKLMCSTWSINHIGTNQLPANWKIKRRWRLQPLRPPTSTVTAGEHVRTPAAICQGTTCISAKPRGALRTIKQLQKMEERENEITDAQSLRPLCVSALTIGTLPAPSALLPHRARPLQGTRSTLQSNPPCCSLITLATSYQIKAVTATAGRHWPLRCGLQRLKSGAATGELLTNIVRHAAASTAKSIFTVDVVVFFPLFW